MKRPTGLGDGWLTGWSWLAGWLKQMGTPLMCGLLPEGEQYEVAVGQRAPFSMIQPVSAGWISTSQATFRASTICSPRGFVRRVPSKGYHPSHDITLFKSTFTFKISIKKIGV